MRFLLTLTKKAGLFLLFLYVLAVNAQQDTTLLNEVVLSAALIKTTALKAPTAVSLVQAAQIQEATPQFSLKEYLGQVPGLFAQNQYNYNQDLRIAIRGFGARAAFGIRGVQILVDGIPETTPDGQGQLDNVPLGIIDHIEVLRGPSGAWYGNAAGGVVLINTLDNLKGQKAALQATGGAFGLASRQATLALSKNKWSSISHYNHSESEGYREQSSFSQKLFNTKLAFRPNSNQRFVLQFNLTDSPYAQDPGGVTLEQAQQKPRTARDANLSYETSEKIRHLKTGLSHRYQWSDNHKRKGHIASYLFAAQRDFTGKLPFKNGGVSAFDRFYYGAGTRLHWQAKGESVLGIGHAQQTDLRERFLNENGIIGARTESQKERYQNTHAFISHKRTYNTWLWSGALRLDYIKMGLPIEKDYNTYTALSPNFTLAYTGYKNQFSALQFAQSFETPTLSEAANTPSGGLGLNKSLTPTKTKSLELIHRRKKQWNKYRLSAELTAFVSETTGELLPYELEIFPGRQLFNNTGVSQRKGIESQWKLKHPNWEWTTAYTYAHYIFKTPNEAALTGNRLPGIPNQHLFSEIRHPLIWKISATLQYEYVGTLMANNQNTVSVDGYQLLHARLHKNFNYSWGSIRVFAGVNNLTNTAYFDNIRINAFGGRYYEPAPTRNSYAGMALRF